MHKPPERAWLWGEFPEPDCTAIAVVGTREPSDQGLTSTRLFVRELVERNVVVVSGGALGIDAAVHEATLEAGGRTIVFAPAWLGDAYPKQNRALFERILENGGAYICLGPAGRPNRNRSFHLRNEAMAAFSSAIVVAQCGYQSGTKNTVKYARKLGREVYVLPSAYGDERGIGSNALVAEGCPIVVSADPFFRKALSDQTASLPGVADDPVVAALQAGAETLEAVVLGSGQSVEIVQHRLLLLTLEGRVREDERGLLRYHAAR
jgi:DNA processing protein